MAGVRPGGTGASMADQAFRNVIKLLTHPATQKLLKHAIRVATIEIVRAIRNRTRTNVKPQTSGR